MFVFNSKTRQEYKVTSNWLRMELSYQWKMGSPNSEDECVILGISWSLWPMKKRFWWSLFQFLYGTTFSCCKTMSTPKQESPVEMQKSELGHRAWVMLSPSETCGKLVVGVKYSNGMLQGNKCCCCCCLYAEQIEKKKKKVQLAVTSWGCLGQKAKSNMPMNLILCFSPAMVLRKVEWST